MVLIGLIVISIVGSGVALGLHGSSGSVYRARVLIIPPRPQVSIASHHQTGLVIAKLAELPDEIAAASAAALSRARVSEIRRGLYVGVGRLGVVEIGVRTSSAAGASALADALAREVTRLEPTVTRLRSGATVLGVSDFGSRPESWGNGSEFAGPPVSARIAGPDPTAKPSIQVVCGAAPGCGVGTSITYPLLRDVRYTATAWVRSASARPVTVTLAFGSSPAAVVTSGQNLVTGRWRRLSAAWTSLADHGGFAVSVQTAAARRATFDVGSVTVTDPTLATVRPVLGALDLREERNLLRVARSSRLVPLPLRATSTSQDLWAAVALALTLFAAACAFTLSRLPRASEAKGGRPARAGTRRHSASLAGVGAGAAVLVGVPAIAAFSYPGSPLPFLIFQFSFAAMLLLVLPKPRRYSYTFLAVLLFLGFSAKLNLHTIIGYAYVEPTGSFNGLGASWDTALLVSSAGAMGVVFARLAQLGWARRGEQNRSVPRTEESTAGPRATPGWFITNRKAIWIGTGTLTLVLAVANLHYAFYQIGVDPKLTLPLHLNVLVAWLVELGVALWIAVLVHWEAIVSEGVPGQASLAPVGEAPAATISSLSRGIYLFHVVPYCLVVFEQRARFRRAVGDRRLAMLAALVCVGFVLSLAAVSALRLETYPTHVPAASQPAVAPVRREPAPRGRHLGRSPSALPVAAVESPYLGSARVGFAIDQVLGLFTDRWNGLEGVMAVSSSGGLGWGLFERALRESPSQGQHAIYQRISGADLQYSHSSGFTFLSLPGIVAILDYSGSLVVVLLGMLLATGLLLVIEQLTVRFSHNSFLAAVSGLAMANGLSEANFPHLLATFFLLMIASLACLIALSYAPRRSRLGLVPGRG